MWTQEDKDRLLKLAIENYPLNTRYHHISTDIIITVKGQLTWRNGNNQHFISDGHSGSVWRDGQWANYEGCNNTGALIEVREFIYEKI